MANKEKRYSIIRLSVQTLATLCAGSETKIIDLLTEYLWDEEEANQIKKPFEETLVPKGETGTDDLAFLKEIRDRLKNGLENRDPVETEFAQQMIEDWISEKEEVV